MSISRIHTIRAMTVALALLGAGTMALQAQFNAVEYVQADNAPWAECYTAAPDPEKAVGSIPGALSVSPSGGAVYTLSIELLSGIEGVQPALSLVVGSQGGDGVLGLGGSLSALSSITRTGSTIHHDGISAGVQYDDRYDRLAWDGQRLIGLDGTGLAATEYRTDVESFARITRQGSGATASFTVRTKDGRTLRYGTTDAARLTYDGGCHTWMLCEVADLQGRYIRYNYAKDATDNEIRLASIEYTGTPSLAPQQRVEFTYGLRTDRWTGTTGPLKQAKTLLLTRIDVEGNGTAAWSYLLHYQLLRGRSCLTTVQKIAPDGSELNSTELLWDYPDKVLSNQNLNLPDWQNRPGQYQVRHFSGDFDGDGISDILTTKWNNSLIEIDENVCMFTLGGVDGMTRTTTYSLPRNQLFDRFDQILEEHGCSGSMATADFDQLSYGLQHLQDVLAADYDGDGITEMMFVCMEYEMNFETIIQQGICEAVTQSDFPLSKYTLPTGRYYCLVYSFKDRKFVHKTTTYSDFLPEYRATDRVNTFRFDFDNDGRSELLDGRDIYQLQGSNLVKIGTSDTDMSAHLVNTWGDFNGDGLMDFVSRSGYVYEREYGNYNYRYAGRVTDKAILGVTDYDQDGEDELIVFDLYDSIHVVRRNDMLPSEYQHMLITYESEGYHVDFYCDAGYQYPWTEGMTEYWDGHRKVPITYIYMYAAKNNGKGMRIYDKEGNEQGEVEMKLFWDLTHVLNADIDNDGREDIVCFDDDKVRCIYYRTDDNYRREDITLSTGDDYFFGDYNGDGSIDLMSASNNRWWTFLSGLVPQPTLYAVRDGMGLRSEITYRPLTDPAVYAKGSGAAYPTVDLAGPVWVVTRIARDNGVAGTQVDHYTYQGAKANLHGKGFFGFSTVTVTDSVPGTTMTTTTTYDDRCGLPLSSTQTTDMGGKTTQQTATYTIEAVNEAQKRYRQRLASRQETDLSGNVVNTTYAEDAWGNPTRETVNYGSGVTAETRTWYRTVDTADRYVCLPDSQSVTRTRGGRHWVEGVRYTYDADCRPLGQVTHTGYRPTATEEYAYNAQGFVAEVKSKPYASNHWLTTTYEYDDRGRVAKETDPLGLSTTYEYDDIGLPMSATDARGNETSYTYDGFGRQTGTRQPDGVTRMEQLMWYTGTDAPDGTLYYMQSAATGQPTSRTYYDATGRELRHEQLRFNGKWLKTDKQYDARGRLWKTSLPSNTTPNRWDVYSYDGQDRPVRIAYSSGKEDVWSYSPNTVEETREGVRSTKQYDASGALLSVSDPGGTITYHLRPDGQPDSISLTGGAVTRFEYDEYGRQLKIDDPSAGVQSYTHDEAGNVATQTDANGKTTSFEYDDYGRVVKRISPEFTTGYAYSDYGELRVETSTNGTSTTFGYDEYGRLSLRVETLADGVGLLQSYTYSNGNVSAILYQSNGGNLNVTENHYYTNGHLSEIKLDGQTSVWKLQTENVRGLTTKVLTGDVTRSYAYDTDGLPTGRSATRAGVTVFAQGYSFDAGTGNLEERTDETRGLAELFTYDHLNRLTGWQVQQDGTRTATHRMAYEANGNLTYLDGTGTLEYAHPQKPYAVTGVYATGAAPQMGFEHEIEYTSFYRPAYIRGDTAQTEFTYNASGDRVKMATQATQMNIRYYLGGCYEFAPQQGRELLYLGGDAYSAPAVYIREGNTWDVYYIIRDYLGSICAITGSGGLVAEYSYDPWGNLRDPETLETYVPGEEPELFLHRGFTGHEHLTAYGLINMNARLYDPMTGRFLSPDPYVQAPDFSQAFNRFSYCWNNPLRYVDEDGEWIHILIGAIIGGIANLVSNWKQADNFWEGLGYFAAGAAVGAGSAALGGWTAGAVKAAGIITGGAVGGAIGAASGAATNVALNGLNNVIGGQNFWNNWKQSAITGAISGAISGAIGGARKGFQLAKEGGKNMWWGNEVKYGRTQWSFFTSEKPYAVVKWDIENVGSLNENDCVPTSFAEANEYFGGDGNYEGYKKTTGYVDGEGVETTREGYGDLVSEHFQSSRIGNPQKILTLENALKAQNKGYLIHTNMPYEGMRHADNLRMIKFYMSGKVKLKYKIGTYNLSSTSSDWWFYLLRGIK